MATATVTSAQRRALETVRERRVFELTAGAGICRWHVTRGRLRSDVLDRLSGAGLIEIGPVAPTGDYAPVLLTAAGRAVLEGIDAAP